MGKFGERERDKEMEVTLEKELVVLKAVYIHNKKTNQRQMGIVWQACCLFAYILITTK